MTEELIIQKMCELANLINYIPKDITFLKDAMHCQRIHNPSDGKNRDNYTNDRFATLGDALLKVILTEYLFDNGFDKGEITSRKQKLEDNTTLCNLRNSSGIIKYAYNDFFFYENAPQENQVCHSEHNVYIEAIIAAIYKDKGFEYCREWVITFFKQHRVLFN